jgi:polyhydroxyalkanoate synthesis regulator phasin
MVGDDRLRKAQKAGADWLETARVRAEEFLRELSRATDTTEGRAQEAVNDLIEGSKKGTEQLVSSIRTEISAQLGLLGLATKADLADLERRLTGKAAGAKKTGPAEKAGPAKKAAPVKKDSPGKKATTSSGSKKAAPTGEAAPKKAAN